MAPLILFAAALLLAPSAASAQALAPVPELRNRVTDLTRTLEASQVSALESKLAALEDETGTQIAVLMVPTVRPETIEQYALRVVEAWRLGREDVDDGALLLVALEDREVRIEVGYGLEGIINDGYAGETIRQDILPSFRQGRYGEGLLNGATRLIARISEKRNVTVPDVPPPQPLKKGPSASTVLAGVVVVIIVLFVIGRVIGRGGPRGPFTGPRRRSTWSGWHGGVGGFGGGFFGGGGFGGFGGGGGGGGFGGFGGGMSGGGGASGRW
jgi:uncharacterized protein